MKWIAALLMIANASIYLWASRHQDIVNEAVIPPKFDVNMAGMLMLNEVRDLKQFGQITNSRQPVTELVELEQNHTEETKSGETVTQTFQQPNPQTTDNSDDTDSSAYAESTPTKPAQDKLQNKPLVGASSCYQLGPFKKQVSWQGATQWMEQNGIEFRRTTSKSRELQAVRVYLGPYQSKSSAESTVQLLKNQHIEYFFYLINGKIRISLGYFTQQELAEKFLSRIESANIHAKSEREYRQLGPFNWLIIPVGSGWGKQLITHDWGEPAVAVSRIDC